MPRVHEMNTILMSRLPGPAWTMKDAPVSPAEKLRYGLNYIQRMIPRLDLQLLVIAGWNTLLARWDRRRGESAHKGEVKG